MISTICLMPRIGDEDEHVDLVWADVLLMRILSIRSAGDFLSRRRFY